MNRKILLCNYFVPLLKEFFIIIRRYRISQKKDGKILGRGMWKINICFFEKLKL